MRGGVVELRDLSLPPGGSLQVDVTVDVACAAGQYAWDVVAKQANRFNGPPGNDFVLDAARSSLTTTVTGGCALRFFTQPQDARVGERLTGTDFDPAGAPVAVEVIDGAGERVDSAAPSASASRPPAVSERCAAPRRPRPWPGSRRSATSASTRPGPTVCSRRPTGCSRSSPPPSRSSRWRSSAWRTSTARVSWRRRARRSRRRRSATQAVDAGFLQLSFNTGFRPDCAGYEEYSADWALVLGPDRQKLVVFTIDKRVMNASPNNGVSFLQMCFAAPFPYATRTGAPPAAGGRGR